MTEKDTKPFPGILHFFRTVFQIILFIPIQIIFIPFGVIGIAIGFYKGVIKSKKMAISFTACRALQYRWYMHYFDIRPDPFSVAFIKKFPYESYFGLLATFGPLIISQRLFGFTTKFGKLDKPGEETYFSFAGPRVLKFDRIVEKYVDIVEQIVIPGAGFDLIALDLTKGKNVTVFELDQTNTLKVKTETLKKAGLKSDWITYIPVDYSSESWVDKLVEAGFDKTKTTLFIWQSVSLYLDANTVKETLRDMADLCVDGSVIVQDFHSKAYLSGDASKAVKKASKMLEKRKPWKFGIDMSNDPKAAVESFLIECGLKMTACIQFGEKLDIKPFYCIVEAEKL